MSGQSPLGPWKCAVGLMFVLALYGCSKPPAQEQQKQPAVDDAKTGTDQPQDADECVRGEPQALLASGSRFMKTAKGEATETVSRDAAPNLTIRHFGCTHYALDFEFTWPDSGAPAKSKALLDAADVLSTLPAQQENSAMLKSLVDTVRKMAADTSSDTVTLSETETVTATTPSNNVLLVRYDVAI